MKETENKRTNSQRERRVNRSICVCDFLLDFFFSSLKTRIIASPASSKMSKLCRLNQYLIHATIDRAHRKQSQHFMRTSFA